MTKIRILTALTSVLLLAAAVSFAHEVHQKHKITLKLDAGALLELDLTDLEVGESKQLYTDDGKEVVVTRQEDGYKVDVDGKELHVVSLGEDMAFGGAKAKVFIGEDGDVVRLEGDAGEHVWVSADDESVEDVQKIMVRRLGGEGEGEHEMEVHVVAGHDGELHTGHHARAYTLKAESAADRLAESGLLDEVDEATRQKILDFLKEDEPKVLHVKTVVVGGDEEDEDE